MLSGPKGKEYTYALRFEFQTTNNEAEYEVLLEGLRIAREMNIRDIQVFVDSQLVSNQVKGLFEAKQPSIKMYLDKMKELIEGFNSFTIEHVRRSQNKKADALSELASMTFAHLTKEVLVEVLPEKSINTKEIFDVIVEEKDN